MTFGNWLSGELAARRWTRSDLAVRIGVSAAAVSRWASDQRIPDEASCRKIAVAFNVAATDVLRRAGHQVGLKSRKEELEQQINDLYAEYLYHHLAAKEYEEELDRLSRELVELDTDERPADPLPAIVAAVNEMNMPDKSRNELLRQIYAAFGLEDTPDTTQSNLHEVLRTTWREVRFPPVPPRSDTSGDESISDSQTALASSNRKQGPHNK